LIQISKEMQSGFKGFLNKLLQSFICRIRQVCSKKYCRRQRSCDCRLTKTIELDHKYAEAFGNRALALLSINKDADADRDFDQCFKLNKALKPEYTRQADIIRHNRAVKQP